MWKYTYLTLLGLLALFFSHDTGFLPAGGFFLLVSFIVIGKTSLQKATIYSALTALTIYFVNTGV